MPASAGAGAPPQTTERLTSAEQERLGAPRSAARGSLAPTRTAPVRFGTEAGTESNWTADWGKFLLILCATALIVAAALALLFET